MLADANADLLRLVLDRRESRHVEIKRSFNWCCKGESKDDSLRIKVARTIMAMSNLRDGGVVIIGLDEDKPNNTFVLKGVAAEHVSSFTQDNVMSFVNEYADPAVDVRVHHLDHEPHRLVVILVSEFLDIPVVCRKDRSGDPSLRRGAIYSRALRKHETVEIPSETEMRELLNLATTKELRRRLEDLSRLGVLESDHNKFDAQLGEM